MAIKKINLGRVMGNVDSSSVIEFTVPNTYIEPVSGGTLFNIIGSFIKKIRLLDADISENTNKIEDILNAFLDRTHPIGSIYMTVDSINPSSIFGGTWVAWGSGRVPVGVNSSNSNFNTPEKTGGASTHVLTASEIPEHAHGIETVLHSTPPGTGGGWFAVNSTDGDYNYNTNSQGGGGAHNNLQPYITCYMWKRTA